MIRFRQKEFIAWLPILTGASLIQGGKQAKEAEEQAEKTKAALDRQTKALNNIAKEAKNNPEIAQQVLQQKQMSRIKLFAAVNPKLLGGFAQDVWKTQKGNVMKAGKIGLGFGAMGYAGNRITTSLKDHDEGNDEKNKSFLKKAALGTAAVGTTYMLARKGKLGKNPIQNSSIKALDGKTGSQVIQGGMEKVGRAINPIQKDSKLGTALNLGFVSMPVVGYLGQRKQQQDQAAQTQEARTYSENDSKKRNGLLKAAAAIGGTAGTIALARRGTFGAGTQKFIGNATANIGGTLNSLGSGKISKILAKDGSMTYAKGIEKSGKLDGRTVTQVARDRYKDSLAPNKISSGASKVGSFIGFYGKGGTKAVQNTANTLAGSENEISQKVGKFMQNHKTLANVGAGVGSAAAGMTIMGAAGKPFEIMDKHAYDYEKQQSQQIQ